MPVVVDASALVAILFEEPEGPAVQARLPASGLVATAMTGFEVANAAVQKVRRGSLTPEKAAAAMVLFGALALELHAVPPDALVPLAQKAGLTAYDAGYLWLARALKADLVTLDSALEKAWLKDKTDDGKTDSQT